MIKGTDNTINLTLKDTDGNVVNINNLAGLVCIIYQYNNIFDKFSKNVQVGFSPIKDIDFANGKFALILNEDKTLSAVVGNDCFIEIKTLSVDIDFAGGDVEKSTGERRLSVVVDSRLKNITFV